jgi:hypothetical protein
MDARAIPQQILAAQAVQGEIQIGLLERLATDAGVDEEIVGLAIEEPQVAVEILVGGRQLEAKGIGIGAIEVAVARQRAVAAIGEECVAGEVLDPPPAEKV